MFTSSCQQGNPKENLQMAQPLKNYSYDYDNSEESNIVIIFWGYIISGVLSQTQVSMAGTRKYIPQIMWDVITFSWPSYLLLPQHSTYHDTTYKTDSTKATLIYIGCFEYHFVLHREILFIIEIPLSGVHPL